MQVAQEQGSAGALTLPDGLVAIVKEDCPTCQMVAPLLGDLAAAGIPLSVYSQDDPSFPAGVPGVIHDADLDVSYRLDVQTVPTLLRVEGRAIVERTEGWQRDRWREIVRNPMLGEGLPTLRPGCGSLTLEPGIAETLALRHGRARFGSRRVELAPLEDEIEACFDRGWSDGLPLVPPTPERVLRMLQQGTSRHPDDIVAVVPPNLVPCSVEKVAINAVMAGCRPEYLPVVLAAVEAACTDAFNIHGVLATTYFVGPVVVVNGPIARAIGMNSGINALGQGNRANATIGRALQLVIRNVGGGRPGEVDRATLGQPGKYTFCFAEDETGSPWEPLSVERGLPAGTSAVTLFAGEAPRGIADQRSRTAGSLVRSFAACLRTTPHPKVTGWEPLVIVCPEHARVFREAGWSKARLRDELNELLTVPGVEMERGAGGMEEGLAAPVPERVPKFRKESILIVHAGGEAGMFSAAAGGWGGVGGSAAVSMEVTL